MSTTAAGRAASKTPRRAAPKPKWNNAVDSRDEQYQLKKKAVILEAARAFGRRGAANVSLDEIAAALNVTKPALYYYFKNKQDLIYECHELTMQVGDEALQKAIESERIAHAFLFCGTRGVGKTSMARILAKAFNCETGIASTPCGACSACTEIDAGRFVEAPRVTLRRFFP